MKSKRVATASKRSSLLGLLAAAAVGCGNSSPSADATSASYTLHFPSTEAAVVTDTVKVAVFDATASPTLCQTLVNERISQQSLPKPILEANPVKLCDLLANGGAFPLVFPYGERAVLVVGTRNDADFLVGCTQVTARDAQFDVPVVLSLVGGDVLPPSTTCTTLADHCGGKC